MNVNSDKYSNVTVSCVQCMQHHHYYISNEIMYQSQLQFWDGVKRSSWIYEIICHYYNTL